MRRLAIRAAAIAVCGLAVFASGIPNETGSLGTRSANAQLRTLSRPSSGSSARTGVSKTGGKAKLNFVATSWKDVLERVARDTDSTLVADRVPSHRYTRRDFQRHSRKDAVRILNDELEKYNFRLIEKNQFLVLIELQSTRQEYRRPQIGAANPQEPPRHTFGETFLPRVEPPRNRQTFGQDVLPEQSQAQHGAAHRLPSQHGRSQTSQFKKATSERASVYSQAQRFTPPVPQKSRSQFEGRFGPAPSKIQRAGFQEYDETPAEEAKPVPKAPDKILIRKAQYKPKTKDARSLAVSLHNAFRNRAEIVDNAIGALPGIRVYSPKDIRGMSKPLFTIGIDIKGNELILEGPDGQVNALSRLLGLLDVKPKVSGEATRLISTNKDARKVTSNLNPVLKTLVAQNDGQVDPPETTETEGGEGEEGTDTPPNLQGVRGNVDIEALEELGAIIIRGNANDVDAVMAIINQIEDLSARSAPNIELRIIEHVDSAALAQLLSTVYEQLSEARGQTTTQRPDISIIPVGRPNAVLILSSPDDLESVNELIDELDKPVAPRTSFKVFRLRHAIASQIETMLEDFYTRQGTGGGATALPERTGLMSRIKIVADVRTNSVIVLAQPNDLKEISKVIEQLDKAGTDTVAQVKVIELRHAVAEELADSLSSIIQATLNPPQQGTQGQLGGFGGGFGGGNSQQLQDVRSAILEFLGDDGARVRSGILSDIRINGDARSNTLIVTAPRESMALVLSLVKKLDRPATAVATIRHFRLKNADAQLTTDLLNELFGDQQTANTTVGVQLAGAEQASSVIPMRFSVDLRTNSVIAVGTAEALEVVEALMYRIDAGDLRNHRTTLIKLKNIASAQVALTIDTFLQNQRDALQTAGLVSNAEQIDQQVFFQSEDTTNTLLISATPKYFDQVRQMVLTLDKEQPQVVIQAMIVEVTLTDIDEFGINLGVQDPIFFERSTATGVGNFDFPSAGLPNASEFRPGNVGTQALSALGVGRTSSAAGFGGLVLTASSEYLNVLLRALQLHRHVEILSRPQVRTLDNQEALLQMVTTQKIPAGFTTQGLNTIQQFEDQTAGITLQVTPTISPDGNILLNMIAVKSAFRDGPLLPDGVGGTFPSTAVDETRAETAIVVSDQQTVVLGGLITRSDATEVRKVPWIGDVPWIGKAFRFEQENIERRELLIFLTPRIIRNSADNELIKQIEAERMSYTEQNIEALHGPIYAVPPEQPRDPNSGIIEIPQSGSWGQPLPLPDAAPPAPPSAPGVEEGDAGIPTSAMPARPGRSVRGQNLPRRQPADKAESVVLQNYERVFNRANWFDRWKKNRNSTGRVSVGSALAQRNH